MNDRVVVDPVTRIEGHLRIEADTAADGQITSAWSSGTMVRGIELILKGRDPRDAWAFAQRICGVCTLVHGIASVRAVENALDYKIPANAQLIRNLMIGAQYVHDHVMHFYHLHALDWVDVVSALSADPKATSELAQSISGYAKSSPGYFSDVQTKVRNFVEAGSWAFSPMATTGTPSIACRPKPTSWPWRITWMPWNGSGTWCRFTPFSAARTPTPTSWWVAHPRRSVTIRPRPPAAPRPPRPTSFHSARSTTSSSACRPSWTRSTCRTRWPWLRSTRTGSRRGEGLGNFLTYGDFPSAGTDDPTSWLIPSGAILDRDLSTIHEVDMNDPAQIQEFVGHSWYDYSGGKDTGLHPYDGETNLNYTGPQPPYEHLDVENSYSWLKAPRWKGHAMEVGPLARVLMLYASGHEPTRELAGAVLKQLDAPLDAMFSTLGRTAARTLETKIIADQMQVWMDNLMANIKAGDLDVHNDEMWDPRTWPSEARGVGFMEAPRGGLAHWIVIKDGKIDNYQAVVPSTWNAGPRDPSGQPGAYEAR